MKPDPDRQALIFECGSWSREAAIGTNVRTRKQASEQSVQPDYIQPLRREGLAGVVEWGLVPAEDFNPVYLREREGFSAENIL